MADINDLFSSFNETITLAGTKADNLRRGRDALRSEIKHWFSENDKNQPSFCWQGSFAMKTTVNPIGDGEYDLDDGIYLSGYSDTELSAWPSTETVHSWIISAVDGHTKQDPIDKNTCVRVVYASGYHIDYPIYIIKDDIPHLAHKSNGWIESDPKAFKDWFIDHVNDNGEQLRRVVKFLKAWTDYTGSPLKGVEITILATNFFSEYEGRDEKSLRDTVRNMLTALEGDFSCKKPVAPYEDLFDDVSEHKKKTILDGLKTLKSELDKAIDEEDPANASEHMIKVFGDRFPKGKAIEKSAESASYAKTTAPGVLRHDGRSA